MDEPKPKPLLTLMADFGGGFLWLNRTGDRDEGVGGACCYYTWACGNHPLSDDLREGIVAWVRDFERAAYQPGGAVENGGFPSRWEWRDFNARGLILATRLKEEVGDDFSVVYEKAAEDPSCGDAERREIRSDGTVVALWSVPPITEVTP